MEGLLRFAESILEGAAALWTGADIDQRLRLQSVLFPQGLRFRDGRFGTAVTYLAFAQLGEESGNASSLASPTGTTEDCTTLDAKGRIAA